MKKSSLSTRALGASWPQAEADVGQVVAAAGHHLDP